LNLEQINDFKHLIIGLLMLEIYYLYKNKRAMLLYLDLSSKLFFLLPDKSLQTKNALLGCSIFCYQAFCNQ